MKVADQLNRLQDIKVNIRSAIMAKGVTVPGATPFIQYADKIREIEDGPPPESGPVFYDENIFQYLVEKFFDVTESLDLSTATLDDVVDIVAMDYMVKYALQPIPIAMTSNTTPAPYVVSASGQWGAGYEPYLAFNNQLNGESWVSNNNVFSNGVGSAWLKFDFGSPTEIQGYVIYKRWNYNNEGYPRDFVLEGSLDDITYDLIDTQVDYLNQANNNIIPQIIEFSDNPVTYRYYRLTITKTWNTSQAYCHVGELYFLGNFPLANIESGIPANASIVLVPNNQLYSESGHNYDMTADRMFNSLFNDTGWVPNSPPQWATINFGTPTEIDGYTLWRRGDYEPEDFPIDFTIQGSNDNTTWDIIDTRTNVQDITVDSTVRYVTFILAARANYQYYKINVTRASGRRSYFGIGEWVFFRMEDA